MSRPLTPTRWPTPGSVVSVPAYLFLRHRGIVSDSFHNGKPMVISNSARTGGVMEESWDTFTSGQPCKVEDRPSQLDVREVLNRARMPPQTRYNVFNWNCESFVAYCYGLPPSSPQLAVLMLVALAGIAVVAARS